MATAEGRSTADLLAEAEYAVMGELGLSLRGLGPAVVDAVLDAVERYRQAPLRIRERAAVSAAGTAAAGLAGGLDAEQLETVLRANVEMGVFFQVGEEITRWDVADRERLWAKVGELMAAGRAERINQETAKIAREVRRARKARAA